MNNYSLSYFKQKVVEMLLWQSIFLWLMSSEVTKLVLICVCDTIVRNDQVKEEV